MLTRHAFAAAFLCLAAGANAQQPAALQQRPSLQQLLNAGYDLKAVHDTTGPCGNQPGNQTQACRRELYFLQSPRKDIVFRCERGIWNGQAVTDCTRL